MPEEPIQQQLKRLAEQWPGMSVADAVADRLNETAAAPALPRSSSRNRYGWLSALATTLLVAAVGIVVALPDSLNVAFQQGLADAESWHVLIESFPQHEAAEKTSGEIWYHRDHGYRSEMAGVTTVDNGTTNHVWTESDDDPQVSLRPSMDGVSMVAELLDLSQIPADWRKSRLKEMDEAVGGSRCEAFAYETSADVTSSQTRHVILIDAGGRARRIVNQVRSGEAWKVIRRVTIDYEREIPASRFALDYPRGAVVTDVQSSLEERFSLENAEATGEKDGLLFAVHECVQIEDGSHYVVSSVRGTADYLRKYPPTKRRMNLNYTAWDVASQPATHGSVDRGIQIVLFHMEWKGVDYLWSWRSPRSARPDVESKNDIPVSLVADHRHQDRRDARGVQLQTRLVLQTPKPDQRRWPIEQVVKKARQDMKLVSRVFGEGGSLPIARSCTPQGMQYTTFDQVTDEAYADELRKSRWQMFSGDYSGNDPPDGADQEIVEQIRLATTPAPPRKPLSAKPTELPAEVKGKVVDAEGNPIQGASVRLRIRRFSSKTPDPEPWTATTDESGNYAVSPSGKIVPRRHEVRIDVRCDGYASVSAYDHEKELLSGTLPTVTLFEGREIHGRLVDASGTGVSDAVVRFQSNNRELSRVWDSGPLSVEEDGSFSLTIPEGGKAGGVVYPKRHAMRFVEVTSTPRQGDIRLEAGERIRGRIVDASGQGVADAIVGLRHTGFLELHAFMVVMGRAVRSDEDGYFRLPPLSGRYNLTVGNSAPDYSRQMVLTGKQPPPVDPITIDTSEIDAGELLLLRAAE